MLWSFAFPVKTLSLFCYYDFGPLNQPADADKFVYGS